MNLKILLIYVAENATDDNYAADFDFALEILKTSKLFEASESVQFCTEQIIVSNIKAKSEV